MIRRIAAVAGVTVREALRQKLAVNLLIFAVLLILSTISISRLTFGEQYRIIVNLGLSGMEIFGTLIAVFLGAGLVAREVERKTLYPVLAKPVSRGLYLSGRYLGLLATVTLNLLVMALVFATVLSVYLRSTRFLATTPYLTVLASMVVRFAMIAAVATFFSCVSTVTLAAVMTLSITVAGQLSSDMVRYWPHFGAVAGALAKLAYALVPNLEVLNFKDAMVYKEAVPWQLAGPALLYGAIYSFAVVALTAAVFTRRDLR